MEKMAGIIGGGVAIILGLLGLIFWWDSFIAILKGGIPVILLLGGIIVLVAGINEIKEIKQQEDKK